MRFLLLFILTLFVMQPGRAQERVRNVRIRVLDSARLEIRYDLLKAQPGDSVYFQIRSRLRGPLLVLPDFVRGDVGKRITAGSDRRIVWNALANGYSLNEDVRAVVLLKPAASSTQTAPTVAATPVPDNPRPSQPTRDPQRQPAPPSQPVPAPTAPPPTVSPPAPGAAPTPGDTDTPVPPRKRYAGPAWALLSAVAPGMGNIFVQTPRPRLGLRPLLTLGCYGLIAYGLTERQAARDGYALYEQQRNRTTAEPYYQQANAHHQRYYLATRGAVAVAAADVILTFFRGLRNQRGPRGTGELKPITLRPGLQAGQPTVVARYPF